MTQEVTLIETIPPSPSLSFAAAEALSKALQLMNLCDDKAPPEMVAYIDKTFRAAASPEVVAALFDRYTEPPPEPKRPRLTAPVRRGLQILAAGIDTGTSSDDVLRAAKWIAEECGHE